MFVRDCPDSLKVFLITVMGSHEFPAYCAKRNCAQIAHWVFSKRRKIVMFVEWDKHTGPDNKNGRIQDFCQGRAPTNGWTYMGWWGWLVADIHKDRFATLQNVYCNAMLDLRWRPSVPFLGWRNHAFGAGRSVPEGGGAPAPAHISWIRRW